MFRWIARWFFRRTGPMMNDVRAAHAEALAKGEESDAGALLEFYNEREKRHREREREGDESLRVRTTCTLMTSGSRYSDKEPELAREDGMDCFALGGFLIEDRDISEVVERHRTFTEKWGLAYPLHSTKIRGRRNAFSWLKSDDSRATAFLDELTLTILSMPITCISVVITLTRLCFPLRSTISTAVASLPDRLRHSRRASLGFAHRKAEPLRSSLSNPERRKTARSLDT